jgi:hypothetical protein
MGKSDGIGQLEFDAKYGNSVLGRDVQRSLALRNILLVGILASIFSALILLAPSAYAVTSHEFETSFGEPGHGAGQLETGSFSGLAVNEATHDIYVADSFNHRVSEFSQSGAFVRAFGADVGGPGINVCTASCVEGTLSSGPGGFEFPAFIAIDNSAGGNGDVYVDDISANKITKFEADGTLVSSWGTGGQLDGNGLEAFGQVTGIAVDASGDLLVMNSEAHFFTFGPDGSFLTSFVSSEEPAASIESGLAVDSAGNMFKIGGFFPHGFATEKLTSTGLGLGQVTTPGSKGIAIDNATGNLYVNHENARLDYYAFNSSGQVVQPAAPCEVKPNGGCPPTLSFGAGHISVPGFMAVDGSTDTVYALDLGAQDIVAFAPLTLPDVVTEPATAVTQNSALLHATIGAGGGPETSCRFQITTSQSFESEGFTGSMELSCVPAGPFSGAAESVSAEATGLKLGERYVFRILGTNEHGTYPDPASKAGALAFRTSGPRIVSTTVSDVTATGATISGAIETNGESTSYRVEYGPTEGYGVTRPVPDAVAALPVAKGNFEEHHSLLESVEMSQGTFVIGQEISGEGIQAGTTITKIEHKFLFGIGERLFITISQPTVGGGFATTLTSPVAIVSQRLSGLAPGTGYHARLVATGVGPANGPDRAFATLSEASGHSGRAYELVSPASKLGEPIPPEPGANLGSPCGPECSPGVNWLAMPMQATADGESLSYEGQPFSAGLASSGNQYVAHRSAGGWSSQSVSPAVAGPSTPPLENGFKAMSSDLSRGVMFQATPALSPEVPASSGTASYNDLYLWEAGSPDLKPLVTVKPPHRSPGQPETFGNQFELSFSGGNSGGEGVAAFSHLVFEANDALTAAVPGVAPAAPEVSAGKCSGYPRFSFPESNCNLYEWIGGQLHLINVLPGNEAAATPAMIGSGRSLTESLASIGEPESQAPDVSHAISADGSKIFWSDGSGQVYVRIDGRETIKIKDSGRFLTASTDGSKVLLTDGCVYSLQRESCETTLGNSNFSFLGTLGASNDLSRIYFIDSEALAPGAQPESCERNEAEEIRGNFPAGSSCNLYVFDHGQVTFITQLMWADNQLGGPVAHYGSWKAAPSNRLAQVTPNGQYLSFVSVGPVTGYNNARAGGLGCTLQSRCSEVYEYDLSTAALRCASCNPTGQQPIGSSTLTLIRSVGPGVPFQQPENLPAEGEGRLLFESNDALLPSDVNGTSTDVYEWTPDAVDNCGRPEGCLALISSGQSRGKSNFITSTPDAKNVFFITRDRLVPQDQDELLDVYDARVGGGFETPGSSPCTAEGCKAAISPPPVQPGAASSVFSGPGNQRQGCKKGYVRKKGKCVKKKTKHKHKKGVQKHKKKKQAHYGKKRSNSAKRGGSK